MGRRIWVVSPETMHGAGSETFKVPAHTYDCRVLSFKQFLPADKEAGRVKHLVQLWTDPGGVRTLSVGSIRLKDPGKVAAGKKAAAALHGNSD